MAEPRRTRDRILDMAFPLFPPDGAPPALPRFAENLAWVVRRDARPVADRLLLTGIKAVSCLGAKYAMRGRTGTNLSENGKKMTDYADIDMILKPWAEKHELHVYVRDRFPPLRSLIIYYWRGKHHESAGHMWLEKQEDGRVNLHGASPQWHLEKTVTIPELETALEDMFQSMINKPVWD
jgi:hypothetical protein